MIEEDIAKDNLRSCSQNTYQLLDWAQSINNPTPPPQVLQAKRTYTRVSAQITSDFNTIKSKTHSFQKVNVAEKAKQQIKKMLREKLKQRKRQVLCRFEYPVIDQTQQIHYWTKTKQETTNNKKRQSVSKAGSRKKLADLVQEQINKFNIKRSQQKQNNMLSPFGSKQHLLISTQPLPTIAKTKIKPKTQYQYQTKPLFTYTSERQESAVKRRSSMPILRHKYKF